MVPPPPLPASAGPSLSPANLLELDAARRGRKKIGRAVFTALTDGWSVGVFGVLSALVGITDLPSLALGTVMIVVAVIEIHAARRLKRLDVTAARTLGWNQVALGSGILVYAIYQLLRAMHGESAYASYIASDPQLAQMLGPIEDLSKQLMIAVYACLIAVAIFVQGGMALYYFTRAGVIRSYLSNTPTWILDLQRAGIAV